MAHSSSIPSGLSVRYASALFDLALAEKKLESVENDLVVFDKIIKVSDDLKRFIRSPVFSSFQQKKAIDGLLKKEGITGLVGNFIRLVVRNRRLFILPQILPAFQELHAKYMGGLLYR